MLRTRHIGSRRINRWDLEEVEKSGRVVDFHNGSKLSCELKIRRYVVPGGQLRLPAPRLRHGRLLADPRTLRRRDYFDVAFLVGNLNSHGIIPAFEK